MSSRDYKVKPRKKGRDNDNTDRCCWEDCSNDRHLSQGYCTYHANMYARAYKFGITIGQLEEYLQINNCEICNTTLTIKHIDHCHHTNRIRGVLCNACNTGLGKFKDDPDLVSAAADYLKSRR